MKFLNMILTHEEKAFTTVSQTHGLYKIEYKGKVTRHSGYSNSVL